MIWLIWFDWLIYNTCVHSNNLFNKEQHSFRAGKSVETAVVDLAEGIIYAFDSKL